MDSKVVLRLSLVVALLAGVVAVALYAYNLGVGQGLLHAPQTVYLNVENLYANNAGLAQDLAEGGRSPASQPGQVSPPYPGRMFHYGPLGFGLAGLRCLVPLLFLALFFVIVRHLRWRGHWHGEWHRHHGERGLPPFFEEWHRRAHESESGKA